VLPGVYAVDPEKCDGCGECFCPYGALEIKGYARKCDLCGGDPQCVKVCVKGLKLEKNAREKSLERDVLGWEKCEGEYETGFQELWPHELIFFQKAMKDYSKQARKGRIDLELFCEEQLQKLGKKQKQRIAKQLKASVKGFSILDPLLEDPEIEEITVNGLDAVRVFHSKKGWLKTDVRFTNPALITQIANKIGRQVGRRLTLKNPRLNSVLPDGSRLHAINPPLSKEPSLTVRKFKKRFMNANALVENKTLSQEAMAFLELAVNCDLNLLICGSTGSGKTTTLNALASFIPLNERVVVIEETPEVSLPHEHCVKMVSNQQLGVSLHQLVKESLRMRPDKVLIGEVRDEKEVKAFLDSMMAGQGKGAMTTFHARNEREAFQRLESLGARKTELACIDLVIVQKRWTSFKQKARQVRKVVSISENLDAKPTPFFEFDYCENRLTQTRKPRIYEEMRKYLGVNERGFERLLEKPFRGEGTD
jgi:Flp pilus assembly CpaF family ATPase